MKTINFTALSAICLIAFYFSISSTIIMGQEAGVMPTQAPGENSVSWDANSNSYKFYHNGILRYEYSILNGVTQNGGTFNVLKAYDEINRFFLPSHYGGISAFLGGVPLYPWEDVNYQNLDHGIIWGDTVVAYWAMIANNDTCKYKYKMKILGRTLVIKVEVDSINEYSNKAKSVELDRCEQAISPVVPIEIPYLPLFHILLSNGIFTSFFADWEITNASDIERKWPSIASASSVWYSHDIFYYPKTDQQRNRVLETLYLTTSPNIEDVFPNIPNPVSPFRDSLANNMVWDYRRPFGWLIGGNGYYLDRLWNAGISNLWVQIHDWQKDQPGTTTLSGYDDGLPCVLPANTNPDYGGTVILNSVIHKARSEYGYRIGLHQNYVDYYPNADCGSEWGWNSQNVALNNLGEWVKAYDNTPYGGIQSYLLKPSVAPVFADHWSQAIQDLYKINGAYLDVHSNQNPSWKVDYNSNTLNAGKLRETLDRYRTCYLKLRMNHNGPIQGEGGYHFFYQGYVDDVEARIMTPTKEQIVYNRPLLVDFDMWKLRPKSFVHGVGWYPLFLGQSNPPPTMEYVLAYIATELAYGHGGYIPDSLNTGINIIDHAKLEYDHVFSVQKDFAEAEPISIEYKDFSAMKSASDYIRDHPTTYNDISSVDFMGKVRIEYSNGVIVYVNRHPTDEWRGINVGVAGGWFNYHANGTLHVGESQTTNFTLPPMNGWVVYVPSKTKVTFTNKIRETNPGGKMLVDKEKLIASGNYSYLKMGLTHNVKTQNERFILDSIYKHNNWNDITSKNYLLNDFYLDQTNQTYDANFQGINPITVKINLLDGGSGGNIQFHDPWYVEQSGSQLNTFKSWASPFSPTGAFGQTIGGVFLDQTPDPNNPNKPYYSVAAISPQPITLYNTGVTSGRSHNFYFQNWSRDYIDGQPSAEFQDSMALQTGVVFKKENAVVKANMKGTQLSNDQNAYANNGQRKFVRTNNGYLHCVYESMNYAWYERSTDGGQTWLLVNRLDRDGWYGIANATWDPSIAYRRNCIFIVYCTEHALRYFAQNLETNEMVEGSIKELNIEEGFSFNNPVICWNDDNANDNRIIIIYERWIGGNTDKFLFAFGNASCDYFSHELDGYLPFVPSGAVNPSISINKLFSNPQVHLTYQLNDEIYYCKVLIDLNTFTWTTPARISGGGYSLNVKPSIVAISNNIPPSPSDEARICWIGKRGGEEVPITENTEITTVFTDPGTPNRFWTFGNGVTSCSINKTNDKYAIAWAIGNNNLITFADNSTLRPVGTINITGKDVQLSNGTTSNTMYALAFNTTGLPYFMQSALVNFNPQPIAEEVEEEREGIVSDGEAQIFFNVGDVVVDNQQISFVDIPDTANINSQQTANQYLISESFSLNNNSEFFYSVRYGITDSLAALGMLNGNTNVTFRVELLDAATNELLGVFDEVTYDQFNIIPYENIAYQVNTNGIGERIVKLRLVINNNFDPEYSVAERYDSQVGVLAKKQHKQINYNGSLAITEYALDQNYPNPFNPTTTINYQIKEDGLVTLKIFDILGSEIKTLVNEDKTKGRYTFNFNASDLASGVYIYQLRVNDFVSSKKLLLLK